MLKRFLIGFSYTLFLCVSWGCSEQKEFIQVGNTIIYAHSIDEIAEDLKISFKEYGPETLRAELLLNGMAVTEILHQTYSQESEEAHLRSLQFWSSLKGETDINNALGLFIGKGSQDKASIVINGPSPSNLSANVAAAIAKIEPKEWSSPIKTQDGWALAYLYERKPGLRSRAHVKLHLFTFYTFQNYQVVEAKHIWENSTLKGSSSLISNLPFEFRNKNK